MQATAIKSAAMNLISRIQVLLSNLLAKSFIFLLAWNAQF
jgi:hypothetical protein